MSTASSPELRTALREFVTPNTARALVPVARDFASYAILVTVAVLAEPLWLRLGAALLAGGCITALFVLGHDAAHDSLTPHPWLNRALAHVLLAPALHNYTLWRVQHNRLHHRSPNVQHLNSWSPFSPREYAALPAWRRALERCYRSGAGFGLYYAVERWWRDKLFPHGAGAASLSPATRRAAWRDFAWVMAWLALTAGALLALAPYGPHASYGEALVFGAVLPYAMWSFLMGGAVYLQHTHVRAPWFRTAAEMERAGGQEHVAVNVRHPYWYEWLGHHIFDHPAHHINPLIPFYRLREAQMRVLELMGNEAVAEPFSLRFLFDTVRRCKLYDYDRCCWTDFAGRPTSARLPDAMTSARAPA